VALARKRSTRSPDAQDALTVFAFRATDILVPDNAASILIVAASRFTFRHIKPSTSKIRAPVGDADFDDQSDGFFQVTEYTGVSSKERIRRSRL